MDKEKTGEPEEKKESEPENSTEEAASTASKKEEEKSAETQKERVSKDGQLQVIDLISISLRDATNVTSV